MKSFRATLFLVIISVSNFFCVFNTNQKEKIKEANKRTDNITIISSKILVNSDTIAFLKIASKFSEEYKAQSTKAKVIASLENIPDSVSNAFKQLRIAENTAYEKYLTLIFLKLYRSHLECCHQGYELRTKIASNIDSLADPLLYEFNLLTKMDDNNKPIEFINSSMAQMWVEKNKELLKYKEIKREYDKIEQIDRNIQKGIYWE